MSSDLEQIKGKISATEAEIATVKQKLAEAEESGNEAKIAKYEAVVERKENLLTEQTAVWKNLLAGSGSAGSMATPARRAAHKSPHRESTKQKNMRAKVMDRNRAFHYPKGNRTNCFKCDICLEETNKPSDYINSHIIAHAHARTLAISRKTNKRLPTSPSYVYNGLFLCRSCDKHFEDHFITIDGNGLITVLEHAVPRRKYSKLNNTTVSWVNEIDANVDWPTQETLIYRNSLAPVIGDHRKLDYGVESDDHSTDSSEAAEEGPAKKKLKKT